MISEGELRTLVLSAQVRGPAGTSGRTKEQLAEVLPDWMRDAIDAYAPGMAQLRASARVSQDRYRDGLVAWMGTLD
ncbi:hypothetical protein ABT160_42830 [Streptomyces sp. NPDC001941]|uniref:hypothetical protein n=1 Tax=Streptomyces sp. NPDC001941 TaxID=3154659 RepID=UPI00332F30AC